MTRPEPMIREHLFAQALLDAVILLSRGYGRKLVMNLVTSRYGLNTWERLAVYRCAHSIDTIKRVRSFTRCLPHTRYAIDGYNAAVSLYCIEEGVPIVLCPDGYVRDVMGGWKPDAETTVELLKSYIAVVSRHLKPESLVVYLDARVSRSGHTASMLRRSGVLAATSRYTDKSVLEAAKVRGFTPITSDIVILERVGGCNHLTHYAFTRKAVVLNAGQLLVEQYPELLDILGVPVPA